MNSIWKDSGVQGLILLFVVFVAAAIISKALDWFSVQHFAIAVAFVALTVFISSVVSMTIAQFQRRYWEDLQRSVLSSCAHLGSRFDALGLAKDVDWLVPELELREIERDINCGEIWIITASLEQEISEEQFMPVIRKNLERGVKYVYLMPDDAVLHERTNTFRRKLGEKLSVNVHFEGISDPLFKIICMQDVALYIPSEATHGHATAYMNLPIPTGGTSLFLKLGATQTETLVAHLRRHRDRNRKGPAAVT